MSGVQLINMQPGEALGYPAYFRAIFDTVLPKQLVVNIDGIAEHQYQALYSEIPYLTPVNPAEPIAGNTVMVFDLLILGNGKTVTVADLVAALDHSKYSTFLRSLERVNKGDVYGDAGVRQRAAAANNAQRESDDESLGHKLGVIVDRLGWVLLVLLALVAAFFALKFYRVVEA